MAHPHIPHFFLYGEPPRSVGARFLHLEALDDRTRPANWNIRPHAHTNLHHLFHIAGGGGRLSADGRALDFAAPSLLVVPANVVHGIEYLAETHGSVLTVADSYLDDLAGREPALRAVFAEARALPLGDATAFSDGLSRLGQELSWTAPGHAALVEALLVGLLVEALRLLRRNDAAATPRRNGAYAELVARFRALVEARYRRGDSIETYAAQLGVHPKRLRAACLRIANASPGQIVQERVLLEAKRLMLYSNVTVAEAAYDLGFDDPAYFTRFFSRRCGVSPRQFRRSAQLA